NGDKRLSIIQSKRKPRLGNERCTAPARHQTSRISDRVHATTRLRIWVPGKYKAVLFRQIGVVVAQVEVEFLVGEGHASRPIEIGRQRESAQMRGLIAEPGIAGSSRERYAQILREHSTRHVEAQPPRRVLTPCAGVRDIRRIGIAPGDAERLANGSIAPDCRFPIVDTVGFAGKSFSGIGEIGYAEIEIDACELGADAPCHSELGKWLGWQLDAGCRGTGV